MSQFLEKPLGIVYGHEEHYSPLLQELRRRGLPFTRIDPADHVYELAQPELSYSLLVNDMSAPPTMCRKNRVSRKPLNTCDTWKSRMAR